MDDNYQAHLYRFVFNNSTTTNLTPSTAQFVQINKINATQTYFSDKNYFSNLMISANDINSFIIQNA